MLEARKSFLIDEIAREEKSLIFIKSIKSERARAGEIIVSLVIRQLQTELQWVTELELNECRL